MLFLLFLILRVIACKSKLAIKASVKRTKPQQFFCNSKGKKTTRILTILQKGTLHLVQASLFFLLRLNIIGTLLL